MASRACTRVILILAWIKLLTAQYSIPSVTIQALKPKGIRVSIPDTPGLSLFVFQGNVNRSIAKNDVGNIMGEITEPTDGRWVFEDLDVQLNVGDVINYYVHVVHNQMGYIKDPDSVIVRELEDPSSKNPTANDCGTTQTRVRNGKACAGNIIFEERFDFLREDVWQIEQYIPDEPDFPFVSYQRPFNAPTVSVQGGNLRIEPKLQQNVPGFGSSIEMGTLDLFSGCTSTSTKCRAEAWGASILPPIVSGRLTTKAFAFTYGLVEIRAKLPQGDWLYPDILLESFLKKYGSLNYASGVVRVGGARGNEQLAVGSTGFGNNLLYGGVLMDATCRDTLLRNKTSSRPWGDDFHVYSVRWTPDVITLSVDGEEWARFAASGDSLKDQFPPSCDVARSALTTGSKLAPFDDHFVITLGIAAGGITEFPDDATSGGKPKPWKNTSRKASLRFWQDIASWIETWRQPALIVDYVTVRAL
ncbi:beta-1,3-glucan-binding protein-like isoform X2 [Bicyclus anynana]|uniref:Beta-1,3-glucan-binding protein-like isoform X2 n=1 Tax=Bicyclus anynana TaxID=110368 RepID=A0ABM3LRX0_BICAN|nr:beta-1,3-glucan-binding protein-like isoform X2 [Bicyclus anynana]